MPIKMPNGVHQSIAIGIDLGGTRIKAGVLRADGRILLRRTIPTEAGNGPDHVINRMVELARSMATDPKLGNGVLAGIGLGSPGTLSQRNGLIIAPPNLPRWSNVPIVQRIRDATGMRTLLENDGNAAAWGEFTAGAGKGAGDLVMMTFGTGIGGGIIVNGAIHRGHFENGAELGHMIIRPGGELCRCGQRGCFEAYASAAHIVRRVREAIDAGEASSCAELLQQRKTLETPDVIAAAQAGDALAARIWDEACQSIAIACINMQHVIDPQLIILAGGMAAAGEPLLTSVCASFDELNWNALTARPEIC
ncbi:MAG: ROK family protein, partial [Phycisphaerae bacterium]